jgi:hypothetical protein
MRVVFDGPKGRVVGTVMRVNTKTISVRPDKGEKYFRVPPSLLQKADSESSLDPSTDPQDFGGILLIRMTQEQVYECLKKSRTADAERRLQRILSVLQNQSGRISILTTETDLELGRIRGWQALALIMAKTQTALGMAGRLYLEVEGLKPNDTSQTPEIQRWLVQLQGLYPWMGAWLDPNSEMAVQLVNALAPATAENGRLVLGPSQLAAATHIANYAVGFTVKLGGKDTSHIDQFLRTIGFKQLPEGFFNGMEDLAKELDGAGHLTQAK